MVRRSRPSTRLLKKKKKEEKIEQYGLKNPIPYTTTSLRTYSSTKREGAKEESLAHSNEDRVT